MPVNSYELARLNAANGTDLTRTVSAFDVRPQIALLPGNVEPDDFSWTTGTEFGSIYPQEETSALEDEYIGHSVGAKAKNYDILDLETGEHYHLAEGTKLQNIEVFAGKGTKKDYRKASWYARKYGGDIDDWQHVKGVGVVETPDGQFKAELHWSECEGMGRLDMFIKRWLE